MADNSPTTNAPAIKAVTAQYSKATASVFHFGSRLMSGW